MTPETDPMTYTIVWGSFASPPPPAAASRAKADLTLVSTNQAAERAGHGRFKIRAADSAGHRSSANILIQRRYAWRGYRTAALPDCQSASCVTLTATDHDATIGTITIGIDNDDGLRADEGFRDEVDDLRCSGWRICEFTKLAVDSSTSSRRVLASLFHVAYLYAHRIQGADLLVMEVNPRHVRYYQSMLGSRVLGEERLNHRVNAPAVLLGLEFSHIREQIARFGGRAEQFLAERSLYPHSFSASEEEGIVRRLQRSAWSNLDVSGSAQPAPRLMAA